MFQAIRSTALQWKSFSSECDESAGAGVDLHSIPHDRNHGEVKITFGKPSSSTCGKLAFEPRSLVAVASNTIGMPVSTTAAKRKSVGLVTRQMSDVRRLVLVTRMRSCASGLWTSGHLHRPFFKDPRWS
jgi:hypothetical protein